MMDNLLMLIIFGTYCLILCAMAFVAGQLLILVIEYLADWIERRQNRAAKQVKAMPHRKAVKR